MLKLLALTLGLMGTISVHAQNVSFLNAKDALTGRCFNPAANQVDSINPNKLIIGIHTGPDYNSCTASTGPYYLRSLSDILTFDVVAPTGYYVSKIKYSLVVTKFVGRTGAATNNNTIVVAGNPLVLPGTGTFQVDLSTSPQHMTSVPVSITTYAFAAPTGNVGGGMASMTFPVIEAEILPLP